MFRIGEFSKMCGVSVPTLRYYDALGLINPAYTDNFTDYRYYDYNNLKEIHKIISLKDAGFSLDEIKIFMNSDVDLISLINEREHELVTQSKRIALQLKLLTDVKSKIESEEINMANIIINNNSKTQIVSVRKIISNRSEIDKIRQQLESENKITGTLIVINYETDPTQTVMDCEIGIETNGRKVTKVIDVYESTASVLCDIDKLCDGYANLIDYIQNNHYQIVGAFYEKYLGDIVELKVPVKKLSENRTEIRNDDIDVQFVDDPDLLGKWQYIDTVPSAEQFNPKKIKNQGWVPFRHLYFLPDGEQYWCYSWTKGYIIYTGGMNESTLEHYYYKDINGERYMFVEWKNGNYLFYNGEPKICILKQLDNKSYTKNEVCIYDDTDMPFVIDEGVLGKWKSCNFIESLDIADEIDLDHYEYSDEKLFWRYVEFLENGKCINITKNGDSVLKWTIGYVLNEYEKTAESYIIKRKNGCDYLLVQWKSGDYVFAEREPYYYVFRRDE